MPGPETQPRQPQTHLNIPGSLKSQPGAPTSYISKDPRKLLKDGASNDVSVSLKSVHADLIRGAAHAEQPHSPFNILRVDQGGAGPNSASRNPPTGTITAVGNY